VHFHEVGAVDSIIDIVGTVFGLNFFGISSLSVSSLPLGSGFADSMHGRIPVPSPATEAILKGVPVFDSGLAHEMVTPTGAALVKVLGNSYGSMPPMIIDAVGYGAGSRDLPDRPNLLRVLIGEDRSEPQVETVVELETNLDDMNPEWLGFLMDKLFEAGALDVVFCPIQMKKNRPATQVQVMCKTEDLNRIIETILTQTSSIGVRYRRCQRAFLKREMVKARTRYGQMAVKKIWDPNGAVRYMPEYEALKKAAVKTGVPLKDLYTHILSDMASLDTEHDSI